MVLMSGQIVIMTRPIRLWSRPSPEYARLVPTVCLLYNYYAYIIYICMLRWSRDDALIAIPPLE